MPSGTPSSGGVGAWSGASSPGSVPGSGRSPTVAGGRSGAWSGAWSEEGSVTSDTPDGLAVGRGDGGGMPSGFGRQSMTYMVPSASTSTPLGKNRASPPSIEAVSSPSVRTTSTPPGGRGPSTVGVIRGTRRVSTISPPGPIARSLWSSPVSNPPSSSPLALKRATLARRSPSTSPRHRTAYPPPGSASIRSGCRPSSGTPLSTSVTLQVPSGPRRWTALWIRSST